MQPWYNARKSGQVAAFFALREGGSINVLKLVKLIYLANRRFMELYDCPMFDDELVSMDHGPVNSITLNYINGLQLERQGWEDFIRDRDGYEVGLASNRIKEQHFDELSRADLGVLNEIWAEFGGLDKYRLRDFTHIFCREWEDPHGSSLPITYERVFDVLGKENSKELADSVILERLINCAFAA